MAANCGQVILHSGFCRRYPDYGSICGNCRAAKGKRPFCLLIPQDRDPFWSGKYFHYVSIVRVDLVADRKRGTMIEIAIEKKEIGGTPILSDIKWKIEEGITLIMGPSGSGKTTLLREMIPRSIV